LRFGSSPIAKALLYFEGMAVDPMYSGDALNSATIVIDVLVRDEQPSHIPIEPARGFTIAERLSPSSPSWFEDQGFDRINPNLCTVYRWVIICAANGASSRIILAKLGICTNICPIRNWKNPNYFKSI
jgi:hypothetical protein